MWREGVRAMSWLTRHQGFRTSLDAGTKITARSLLDFSYRQSSTT